jgi:hypothetical protein
VTAIAIIIISLTLFWARPLIDRAQDQQEVLHMEQKFLELHDSIKNVAAGQGSLSIPFDIKRGSITLAANNTINYQGQFDTGNPVSKKLVFGNNTAPTTSLVPTVEEVVPLGIEEPAYLYEQGAVEFNLHYRIVNDTSTGICYRIKLVPGQQPGAGVGTHVLRLTWLYENTTSYTGCTSLKDQLVEFTII